MKIGSRTTFYNFKMRERRKELGLTQGQLADMVGIAQTSLGNIELLRDPSIDIDKLPTVLFTISDFLESTMEEIFPKDYLNALETGLLKGEKNPFNKTRHIMHDVSINQLSNQELLQLTEPSFIEEEVDLVELKEIISEVLDTLPPREKRILEYRYGLNGKEETSLDATAKKFGVTRERVRQIEASAFSRLHRPKVRKILQEYR